MIEIRAVRGSLTAPLLVELVRAAGVEVGTVADGANAIVSYGVPVQGELPALNKKAGSFDKLQELTTMRDAGVRVPPFSVSGEGLSFPMLGRRRHHSKARDIIAILQNDREFEWRKAGGASDYFVQYVPIEQEYRVWAYRRRPIAVYQKTLVRPEEYRRIGRNFENGFAFQFVEAPPEGLREIGAQAINVLGLDFGAADILLGKDGLFYVLEVNTAPGVQGARQCMTGLTRKIVRWVELGYPRRNNE